MTPRQEIQEQTLRARDSLATAGWGLKRCALAVNVAFEHVGKLDNNDRDTLVQIAALVLIMAEHAALNGNKVTP